MTEKKFVSQSVFESDKVKGGFEVKPLFSKQGVYFHPIPRKSIKTKDNPDGVVDFPGTYWGYFLQSKDTGKIDKRGIKIFQRFFIPTMRV